ncbi:MAG TPA: S-layer family protein [Allocoleopsis sp.]
MRLPSIDGDSQLIAMGRKLEMKGCYLEASLLVGSVLYALFSSHLCAAQVVGDTTLSVGKRSQVSGNPNFQIDGGARQGGNLFHSFQSFSIPTGGSACFNNAADVQNIFSRVTGGSISNIDGVIRANGTASLFLLNPNGILFGAGARLNIGGSFVASTANSINFADNFHYSATNPQTTPLLTVSVPVGLQMGANPGQIAVQGNGYNISVTTPLLTPLIRGNASTGLKVASGQTLALIGGDIDIQGGVLTAEQGRIELGSMRDGQVNLGAGFALSYPGISTFGNIHLSRQALADASGSPGDSIQVQGDRVSLTDGSLLLIQNQGEQSAGSLRVNAADSLELSGISSSGQFRGGLNTETINSGRGANVVVSTRQLLVRDGAGISTPSYGAGRAGDITVSVADSAQLIGYTANFVSTINAFALSSGNGGNITLSTERLSLLNGAIITAGAAAGSGNAGDVTINATDSVELIGVGTFTSSNVSSTSSFRSTGNGGNVTVNSSRLVIRGGGSVTSLTFGTGRAGSVTINATQSVELSGIGQVPFILFPSQVSASAQPYPPDLFPNPPIPNQNSGNVVINTGRLSVTDGAKVDVSHEGTASAGTLRINANSILLDRNGSITATTASGEGGNIDLNVRDFILLRNGSPITASAGGTGNGGNIRINTSSLVAIPNENSDIRANSVNARGGNVTINTSGLFGIQFRPQDTPLSDITTTGASSELSGTVEINVQDVDPTRGLTQLPTDVVDASRLVAQGCRDVQGSSFVVSGSGGVPPTPQQALGDDPRWRDWRTPAGVSRQSHALGQRTLAPSANPRTKSAVVEATGWVIEPDGKVILTATAPNVTSAQRWGQPVNCDGS